MTDPPACTASPWSHPHRRRALDRSGHPARSLNILNFTGLAELVGLGDVHDHPRPGPPYEVVGVNLDGANSARATPPSDGVVHADEDHPHNMQTRAFDGSENCVSDEVRRFDPGPDWTAHAVQVTTGPTSTSPRDTRSSLAQVSTWRGSHP